MKRTSQILAGLTLWVALAAQAQFQYQVTNGTITITGYTGSGGAVVIPSAINDLPVVNIGDYAFYGFATFGYELTSVAIPDSVTNIGDEAFAGCNLTNIAIGNGVASIGDGAFVGDQSLASMTIPDRVANIGEGAFIQCSSLTNIVVAAQNPDYSSLDGVVFDKNQTKLIQFPPGIGGAYTIPNSVTNIGNQAFYGSALTSVKIPDSVIAIENEAFGSCQNLSSVTIGNGVIAIGYSAFGSCQNLTSVTIGNSVTSIGEDAFAADVLAGITIPASVTNIGVAAFLDCVNLAAVFFQGNAPAVVSSAFVEFDVFGFAPLDALAYYLPGTTGWDDFSTNTSLSTVLWNPLIQTGDGSFGIQNNQFGFNITGTTNIPVAVEVSTNLANPVWLPLQTVTLTNGSVYFSEPLQTSVSGRFYRLGFP